MRTATPNTAAATISALALSLSGIETSRAWLPSLPSRTRTGPSPSALFSGDNCNNNVVFRPSESSDAFDSFKVGTARVHRYSDPDSADPSEYVMWYHGRDANFDPDRSLPPLTTGRIGRALSRNGLAWERDAVGSFDADVPGASLGLNTDSWWGFDTAHVGLGQVMMPMTTPTIRSEGGVYVMYYMGGSFEETDVKNYVEDEAKAAALPEGASLKGMKFRIGTAISQDGVTWGRVEGDDSTGACVVPFDRDDPNADDHVNGKAVEEELYCGWPEVVVNPIGFLEAPPETTNLLDVTMNAIGGGVGGTALNKEKRENFLMYYSTMLKETKEKAIGFAFSDNGFSWAKEGVCLRPTPGTLDGAGCARCNVIRNMDYDEETGRWDESKKEGWLMMYEGISSEDGKHRILAAESVDGKVWTKLGLMLDVGGKDDNWDAKSVGSPHVLRMDDGALRMYYVGENKDGQTAVGVARSYGDICDWKREQAEITFAME